MESYIKLLKYITKYFKRDNKFDKIINHIMNIIFYEYHYNQDDRFYCLIKKFSERYYRLNKRNEISKMSITLNYYSKRKDIDKILRQHEYFNSYKNIDEITDYILELKKKNYDKQLFVLFFSIYLNKFDIEIEKRLLDGIFAYT